MWEIISSFIPGLSFLDLVSDLTLGAIVLLGIVVMATFKIISIIVNTIMLDPATTGKTGRVVQLTAVTIVICLFSVTSFLLGAEYNSFRINEATQVNFANPNAEYIISEKKLYLLIGTKPVLSADVEVEVPYFYNTYGNVKLVFGVDSITFFAANDKLLLKGKCDPEIAEKAKTIINNTVVSCYLHD